MSSFLCGSRFLFAVFVCMVSFALIGCAGPSSETSSNDGAQSAKKSSLPYFSFHQPKEIKVAVERIRELHDAITGSDPLPEPIFYQVKEVVHGSGPSEHSHYYFHDPKTAEKDEATPAETDPVDEDGHVTTGENIHDVTVEPLAELKDLMRWLPKIASNGDMPESEWVKVNQISKELAPKLREILKQSNDSQKRRSGYREAAASWESQISTLEELVK